jgi:hypothetical protein
MHELELELKVSKLLSRKTFLAHSQIAVAKNTCGGRRMKHRFTQRGNPFFESFLLDQQQAELAVGLVPVRLEMGRLAASGNGLVELVLLGEIGRLNAERPGEILAGHGVRAEFQGRTQASDRFLALLLLEVRDAEVEMSIRILGVFPDGLPASGYRILPQVKLFSVLLAQHRGKVVVCLRKIVW